MKSSTTSNRKSMVLPKYYRGVIIAPCALLTLFHQDLVSYPQFSHDTSATSFPRSTQYTFRSAPSSTSTIDPHPAMHNANPQNNCTQVTVIKLRIHPHSITHKHQPTRPYLPHKPLTSQTTTQHKHTRKIASIPNKPSSVKLAPKTHISYPCCSLTIPKLPFLRISSYQ